MTIVLERRVKVRDDGTGKGEVEPKSFSNFENEDAIVLLGDPGMGKTTLFRSSSKGAHYSIRNFLIEPKSGGNKPLYLDGLDEFRSLSNGDDTTATIAKALIELKKPKFRISCRAADWFGSLDQDALRIASKSGKIVVLELLPLNRDEIQIAVESLISEPSAFVAEAEAARLGHLLGNPQTLELIAYAWRSPQKPQNRFDAYNLGISEMIKEMNQIHVKRGSAARDAGKIRKAAGSICSGLLLSNSAGVARTESNAVKGFASSTSFTHGDLQHIDEALKRRIFTSNDTDLFEPTHRTLSEFLAAEDLGRRINEGLPVTRVMALICGIDGRPVSSLRGLFAWLMPWLQTAAEAYVVRDPYGVATYGDAGALTPRGQCMVWEGLKSVQDPWFLAKENDRGSFQALASESTRDTIKHILENPDTRMHLLIAALEAIANSKPDPALATHVKLLILAEGADKWIRQTALRAYARCVNDDWTKLKALDEELTAAKDYDAPEIRIGLLLLIPTHGILAERILSILTQAAQGDRERGSIGHLTSLKRLPTLSDIELILDGAGSVLKEKHYSQNQYGLRSVFEEWFARRLKNELPIQASRLAVWLRSIRLNKELTNPDSERSLSNRFKIQPNLFEEVFEALQLGIGASANAYRLFIMHDFWQMIPAAEWPVSPAVFFLMRAKKETSPERAALLYSLHAANFPDDPSAIELAEEGLSFAEGSEDVRRILGESWNACALEDWRTSRSQDRHESTTQLETMRQNHLEYFMPRLAQLRSGRETHALVWMTRIYAGLSWVNGLDSSLPPREQLVAISNEEIADAILEGFNNFCDHSNITADALVEGWIKNSIPIEGITLSLSVYFHEQRNEPIPHAALERCLAAVLINLETNQEIDGFDLALDGWISQQAVLVPELLKPLLIRLWTGSITEKRLTFPGYYKFRDDDHARPLLIDCCASMLRSGIREDAKAVAKFISVLMQHDANTVLEIARVQIAKTDLLQNVSTLWTCVLFVLEPETYGPNWRALREVSLDSLWFAIKFIAGDSMERFKPTRLTTRQRFEVIAMIGRRFPSVERPSGAFWGDTNPWDASDFVSSQIQLVCSDESADADELIQALAADDQLQSYQDLIKHLFVQRQKVRREHSFTFAPISRVADALGNAAPATAIDLLAYTTEHLQILANELRHTQRERYRAYWNQDGYNLVKPKPEPDCSGLLAEDLLHRIKPHQLIVTVEHHMVADKECDLVVLQGTERMLPIEAKHHYHKELWTAWKTQLDRLYTRDAQAGGLGVYAIFWSGEDDGRKLPKPPTGTELPTSASKLKDALEALIPENDRGRLKVVVIDISQASS